MPPGTRSPPPFARAACKTQRLLSDSRGRCCLPPSTWTTNAPEHARNTRSTSGSVRLRLKNLVVAECLENKGRFLDDIANGVWAICEESTWCLPAHISVQKAGNNLPDIAEPIVDLFAADTGSLIAWTWYLLNPSLDKVSPLIRQRAAREVEARILIPYAKRIDFWWMGLDPGLSRDMNNWNPWINSNCLTCALLMAAEPERSKLVHKVLRSVDRFLDSYHDDGGCDEGPGYWNHAGGSLFENLELLYSASGGKVDFYSIPLVAEIGRYIYRAHIDKDWYTNFADASARAGVQGDLIYRYGARIKDPAMQSHGAYVVSLDEKPLDSASGSIDRQLSAIFNWERLHMTPPRAPYARDVFLPQSHFFAARRKSGSPEGFYIAAQGGHNNESHNHNDVGNLIVCLDGRPLLIDIGVETYTAKTFSSRTVRDLDDAVGLAQLPHRERCHAERRAANSRLLVSLPSPKRRRPLSRSIWKRPTRRKQASAPGGGHCRSTGPATRSRWRTAGVWSAPPCSSSVSSPTCRSPPRPELSPSAALPSCTMTLPSMP